MSGNGNSVLDERGDVVMFRDDIGTHLFRDDVGEGLRISDTGFGHWVIWRPLGATGGEYLAQGGWSKDRAEYVAWDMTGTRVVARHDTQYGLLAKVARIYLRAKKKTPTE